MKIKNTIKFLRYELSNNNIRIYSILIGSFSLSVAISSMIISFTSIFSPVISYILSLLLAIVSLYLSWIGLSDSFSLGEFQPRQMHDFKVTANTEFKASTTRSLTTLLPSKKEAEFGYTIAKGSSNRNLPALWSPLVNSWLTVKQPIIELRLEKSRKFLSKNPEVQKAQLTFLYAKCFKKGNPSNGDKIGLVSTLFKEINEIKYRKVGYFDSIVTNEAFANVIEEAEEQAAFGSKKIDLTDNYPAAASINGRRKEYRILPIDSTGLANQIGISLLVISRDGFPIMFQQREDMAQDGGLLISSGSGSMNFSDIKLSGANDLVSVAKYSMAREFFEEANVAGLKSTEQCSVKEFAGAVSILGHFRWLSRCGKPELIGVARAPWKREEISARKDEVHNLPEGSEIHKVLIDDLSSFISLLKTVDKLAQKPSLDTLMLLTRLAEIAGLEENDEQKKSLKRTLFS